MPATITGSFGTSLVAWRVEREKRRRLLEEKAATLSFEGGAKPMSWSEFGENNADLKKPTTKDVIIGAVQGLLLGGALLLTSVAVGVVVTPLVVIGFLAVPSLLMGAASVYESTRDKQPQRLIDAYDRYLTQFERQASQAPKREPETTPIKYAERILSERLERSAALSNAR
jgi:hypothetical protein